MKRIKETIIVEGRYDINKLKQCVDAHIVETAGFGIFNDKEKRELIAMLAKKRGIIILTDSDGAGQVIRNFLKGAISDGSVKHAYIPEIEGKERRKSTASKAGYLGVEGMSEEIILNALRASGATFEDEETREVSGLTKSDMYFYGLSGRDDSAARRKKLAKKLGLPSILGANALLDAINLIFTKEELEKALSELE